MANPPRRRASSPIRRTVLDRIPEASPPQVASTSARRVAAPASNALPTPARAVTPGPNAFALRAAEVEAHRLRSNAFYQQVTAAEYLRRLALQDQEMASLELTPPTAVHPALRENFCLGDSSPCSNPMANQAGVDRAKSNLKQSGQTPPLKLIPEEHFQGNPTDRNFIEGFHEELEPKDPGNETGRIRVFKHTPKLRSSDFSKSVGSATPQKKKGGVLNWVANGEQPSSPKKGLFEKLGLTTTRTPQTPNPTYPLPTTRGDNGGEALPPKAKAVLSTTPQKNTLGRSPSKKLSMFARKASDAVFSSEMAKARRSLGNEQQQATSTSTRKVNFSASVGRKTPAREQRPKVKRIASQPQPQKHSEQNGDKIAVRGHISGVFRSDSLQYFDRQNPPTPPAKNTPPHEKKSKAEDEEADHKLKTQQDEANRILEAHKARSENQAEALSNMSPRKPVTTTPQREMQQKPESKLTSPLHHKLFEDDTPTRETFKLIGEDGRTSPTKFGSYAHKHLPTIVKTPSVYSMKAGYFPDLHEEHSFEDVKKCSDDLGLDGLREIPENYYKGELNIVHSPSIYEDDWSTKGSVSHQASSDTLHFTGMFKPSPSMPDVLEHVRQLSSPAVPVSGEKQARQLPSKIPTSSKKSPMTKARTSSRSSSKGSIPLMYPGLAYDPSRMNLLEGLNIRRGSASGLRTSMPRHLHDNAYGTHRQSFESLFERSIEDLTKISPDTYSHPSAKPSPLYSPSSVAFSPVVPSTPPGKGNNEAISASPSPRTLTPSRRRGRIEDYKKSTGSPLARNIDSFSVESQTMKLPPPQLKSLTPVISVTPPTASPAVFLSASGKTNLVRCAPEKPFIPLSLPAASTGAAQSDPRKVDNVKPSSGYDANNLLPSTNVVDYTSYLANHKHDVLDHDGLVRESIISQQTEEENLPSWYREVMAGQIHGKKSTEKPVSDSTSKQNTSNKTSGPILTKEKPEFDSSQELSDTEEGLQSWRYLAKQQQAQIAALKAEMAKITAQKSQEDELATLRSTVQELKAAAPTSASTSASAIRQYLASGADIELERSEAGSLRSLGLYHKVQQPHVETGMRESEKVLRRMFEASSEAQRESKAGKDFVGEGGSKEASLAAVLAAIGGLSQRIEAIEAEKKSGQ